jgi:hypothetical protein
VRGVPGCRGGARGERVRQVCGKCKKFLAKDVAISFRVMIRSVGWWWGKVGEGRRVVAMGATV